MYSTGVDDIILNAYNIDGENSTMTDVIEITEEDI